MSLNAGLQRLRWPRTELGELGVLIVILLPLLVLGSLGLQRTTGQWPFEPEVGPLPPSAAAAPGLGRPIVVMGESTALAVLASLEVKGRAPATGYSRELFGQSWSDADSNGCDTRNDILRRDLQAAKLLVTDPCVVVAGVLADPYTAKSITFERGPETSKAIQIDHVVALSNAWQTGAQQLNPTQLTNLANDPLNLLAVSGQSNQDKLASDAASWLPPNRQIRCLYVARQVSVKAAYKLWVTPAEKSAIERVLNRCPQQPAFASGYRS